MTGFRVLLVLLAMAAAPSLAMAQDEGTDQSQEQPQDQPEDQSSSESQPANDPVTTLQGLWRVDRADGEAASGGALMGRMMRIDRTAVASLTAGTCTNPGFVASGDAMVSKVEITCLGEVMATAEWDPATADTVNWSEPNLQAVLHRVAAAAP